MSKQIIVTDKAPKAIGPYSQAVQAGGFLFCSGQIPLDPATGELLDSGIREQTELVMDNISFVLGAAGLTFSDVVKSTIYLTDLANFAKVNDAMALHMREPYPARATVGVKELPRGALVEVDAVLVLG